MKLFALLLLSLCITTTAFAQEDMPPQGPRDVLTQNGGGPEVPPGHEGMDAMEQNARAALSGRTPSLASAEPANDVPAGAIEVTVVDIEAHPVANAAVEVGMRDQSDARETFEARTGADGKHVFTGLATGSTQSYRVRVPFEGAVYTSTPFQLPADRGYRVRVLRLATTRDDRRVIQFLGQASLEIRDERLHVVQQAQLVNLGDRTYVFPDEGLEVRLPAGFTAFQSEDMMSDQRFVSNDRGFALQGSIPPGRITLTWGYDLPVRGSTMDIDLPISFRTIHYRLVAEAPPGLEMHADEMPEPEAYDEQGHHLMETVIQRSPTDPELEHVHVTLRNIPGPGPQRWIAVGAGLAIILAGFLFFARGGAEKQVEAGARTARKNALLDEVVEIERMFAKGEIGPSYRSRQLEALEVELASLLRDEARVAAPAAKRS